MTPAEFKTLRESLWLSQQDVADLANVQKRTVQYWESGNRPRGVPDDVSDLIKRLDALVEGTVLNVVEFITDCGEKPEKAVFLRYNSNEDLKKYKPHDHQALGSVKVHSAMVDRIRTALSRLDVETRITFMDPDKYEQWRLAEGFEDGEDTRAKWASQQVE
ncbi:DUF4447 family protein [Kiloniella litopenaei]|uniref:DUF4447 family protein n=1 Tax=Kiloniella litopenaei TaxID=1549748 RepID=UPI003BABA5B5